jgi:hypothetical protein
MEADLQEQLAFVLTGRAGAGLSPIAPLRLRPATLARYRTLTTLRHDYPLVLASGAGGEPVILSLSGLIDALLGAVGVGGDAERLRHHAFRLERKIREAVAAGATGTLSVLWDQAERQLLTKGEPLLKDSCARLRGALSVDGEVVGCDRALPVRLFTHVWQRAQARKVRRLQEEIDRLARKLSDILGAAEANSETGLSADRLRASLGRAFANDFDFGTMSRVLTTTRPMVRLSDARRARVEHLLATLRAHGFAPADFVFKTLGDALEAYAQRLPGVTALANTITAAGLEIDGRYRDGTHDAVFAALGVRELGPADRAQFPDYLVCLEADTLRATDIAQLTEALSAGVPLKVLVQTDDLLEPSQFGESHPSAGLAARKLVQAAIEAADVYVLQSPSSHLYRFREQIRRGVEFAGPALFSVHSGMGEWIDDLPPYLASAAALESRAFPGFVYDPSAGPDWASRFSIDQNPQAEHDWPAHDLSYEDGSLQRVSEEARFTLVDLLACDARYAGYFARVPQERWNGSMVSVPEFMANGPQGPPDKVPYVLMADASGGLHRVLVDARLIREAWRSREQWRSLQEWGGVHSSHVERALARERKARDEQAQREAEARAAEAVAVVEVAPTAAAPAGAAPAPAEPAEAKPAGEPYIETVRCSTCNECTKINDRMFKYNQNKQAYIADLRAGTYAQMVQAAESCQVAVIHPGKPWNPDEPGLEELLKRAEAFG